SQSIFYPGKKAPFPDTELKAPINAGKSRIVLYIFILFLVTFQRAVRSGIITVTFALAAQHREKPADIYIRHFHTVFADFERLDTFDVSQVFFRAQLCSCVAKSS